MRLASMAARRKRRDRSPVAREGMSTATHENGDVRKGRRGSHR